MTATEAREVDEVAVGSVVRFSRAERWLHWSNATLFLVLLATGMTLYVPGLSEVVGRRVLVTRARDQADDFVDRLSALGAEAVEAPMIQIAPPEDPGPLAVAAAQASEFDWIVFTSPNAVDAFMHALLDADRDVRALSGPRLCTVGAARNSA